MIKTGKGPAGKGPAGKGPLNAGLRRDEASVQGFKDHDVHTPKVTLRSFARKAEGRYDDQGFDLAAIEKAEAAVAELAGEFADWMAEETETLVAARNALRADPGSDDAVQAVYAAAHDIRGGAATFGFPLAGRVADSLCRLIDAGPPAAVPQALMFQHVDAIRAIVREGARGEGDPVGSALVQELGALVEAHVLTLAGAPPLAPT